VFTSLYIAIIQNCRIGLVFDIDKKKNKKIQAAILIIKVVLLLSVVQCYEREKKMLKMNARGKNC